MVHPGVSDSTGRRAKKRGQTRDRMLDAAADLLRSEGPGSLTTVRVTREAGIAQSGFYAHFKNPDHLQQELAEIAGRSLREHIASWMAVMRLSGTDEASLAEGYVQVLELFREQKGLMDLFLRFRRSPSPIGQAFAHLHTQLRADFFQYLRERAGDAETVKAHLGIVGVHADTLVAALLGVGEGVVEGRVGDLRIAAAELAALTHEPLRRLIHG